MNYTPKNYREMEKMKELVLGLMENLWGDLVRWMDKVFPPEARGKQINHWFHLCIPFLIGGLVLVTCFYCWDCCCYHRGGGGRAVPVKMMKAPGRGYRMARHIFESNPQSYFRNLQSNPTTCLIPTAPTIFIFIFLVQLLVLC